MVRTTIAITAGEDLGLDAEGISMAFLDGNINKGIYMMIPEGFEVEGDGEDPKHRS